MGFFDFLSDEVDSIKENNDKRRQAREYTQRAKEIVKDYEERYNTTYVNTVSYAYKTQFKVEEHYKFKKELIKEIDLKIKPVFNRFDKFDIDKKTFDMEFANTKEFNFNSTAVGNKFNSLKDEMALSSVIENNSLILDLFSDATEEYWEAKRLLDEAKQYKREIQYQREKLKTMKSNLGELRQYIIDEREMLNDLSIKAKKITSTLETSMKKNVFTQEEAEKLKSINKIGKGISKLMTIKFLNSDFSINNEYKMVYDSISEINNMIPRTPTIQSNTWKNISQLLDEMVVY